MNYKSNQGDPQTKEVRTSRKSIQVGVQLDVSAEQVDFINRELRCVGVHHEPFQGLYHGYVEYAIDVLPAYYACISDDSVRSLDRIAKLSSTRYCIMLTERSIKFYAR